jgi:hypothetical protein
MWTAEAVALLVSASAFVLAVFPSLKTSHLDLAVIGFFQVSLMPSSFRSYCFQFARYQQWDYQDNRSLSAPLERF